MAFFSDYKFRKINISIIVNDIRIIIFQKITGKFSLLTIIKNNFFLFLIKFLFLFYENFQFIIYLILMIEIGDLYGNFIKSLEKLSLNFKYKR